MRWFIAILLSGYVNTTEFTNSNVQSIIVADDNKIATVSDKGVVLRDFANNKIETKIKMTVPSVFAIGSYYQFAIATKDTTDIIDIKHQKILQSFDYVSKYVLASRVTSVSISGKGLYHYAIAGWGCAGVIIYKISHEELEPKEFEKDIKE